MNMSKFLSDIKTYLSVDKSITTPIYLVSLPESSVPAICLYEYAGEQPDTLVDIYKPRLQVKVQVARTAYETGRALMAEIESYLQGLSNTALTNNYIIQSFMITGTIPLQMDPEGNMEFLSNFRFQVR